MNLYAKFAAVGGATMASRVLGFVREAMIAAALGAGPVADAFYAAFRFPNFFRRLFAEGAFASAFVPLVSEKVEKGGCEAAQHFSAQIFSVLLTTLVLLTVLAEIFMPFLVASIIAPSFADTAEKFDLTVLLARIMFPYLTAMSLMAMYAAILNSMRRYFLAALAPVLLNIVLIIVLAIALFVAFNQRNTGVMMSIGVVTGGICQFGLLWWALRREGFRFSWLRPRLSAPVKRFLALAAPTAFAGGITQLNLLISQIIASAQDGAISLLQYADRIYQLPLGVVGIAVGVVLLPEMTRALADNRIKDGERLLDESLEFAMLLVLPAAAGIFLLSEPVTALLFERGAFDRETTILVARALEAFSIGLPGFMLISVFKSAYFARKDTTSPMRYASVNALINVVLGLILFQYYGHVGLAAATSIAGWVNAVLLLNGLWRGGLWRPQPQTLKNLGFIATASIVMGITLLVISNWTGLLLLDAGLALRIALIGSAIASGAFVYFLLLHISGSLRIDQMRSAFRRNR